MRLDEASKLGTTQDVFSSMQLFGLIFKIVFPFIAVLVCIEIFKAIRKVLDKKIKRDGLERQKNKEKEKQYKKITNAQKERNKRINKLYEDDEFLIKQLEGTHEPFDKSTYHDLDLTFDKNGKVIK